MTQFNMAHSTSHLLCVFTVIISVVTVMFPPVTGAGQTKCPIVDSLVELSCPSNDTGTANETHTFNATDSSNDDESYCCHENDDSMVVQFCCSREEWVEQQPPISKDDLAACGLICLGGILAGCLVFVGVCGYLVRYVTPASRTEREDKGLNNKALKKSPGPVVGISFVRVEDVPGCSTDVDLPHQ